MKQLYFAEQLTIHRIVNCVFTIHNKCPSLHLISIHVLPEVEKKVENIYYCLKIDLTQLRDFKYFKDMKTFQKN